MSDIEAIYQVLAERRNLSRTDFAVMRDPNSVQTLTFFSNYPITFTCCFFQLLPAKDHPPTPHVNVPSSAPVIVLPFEFTKEVEGTDENMGGRDYKSYMTCDEQLEDLLAGLLKDRLPVTIQEHWVEAQLK